MEDKAALEQLADIVKKAMSKLERFCSISPDDDLKADAKQQLIVLQDLMYWLRLKWRLIDKP